MKKSKSKLKLSYDRRSVGQSVLVPSHNLGSATNFSFISMIIIFRHLQIYCWGAPFLTRGRICKLFVHCYSLFGPSPTKLVTINSLSHLTLNFLLIAFYYSQGYGGGVLTNLQAGLLGYKTSSYLTGNTIRLRYRAQSFNAIFDLRFSRRWLWRMPSSWI
jgi:hypothetical protein